MPAGRLCLQTGARSVSESLLVLLEQASGARVWPRHVLELPEVPSIEVDESVNRPYGSSSYRVTYSFLLSRNLSFAQEGLQMFIEKRFSFFGAVWSKRHSTISAAWLSPEPRHFETIRDLSSVWTMRANVLS